MTILWDLFSNNCRMPKISILQEFLSESGFGLGSVMVLPDLLFKPEHWYDKEMPFRKHWKTTVKYIHRNQHAPQSLIKPSTHTVSLIWLLMRNWRSL